MRELLATLTSKGQITLPRDVREALGLKKGDKVAFLIEEHAVRLRRTGSVVAATAGALKGAHRAASAEQLRDLAADAIAQESAERGGSDTAHG